MIDVIDYANKQTSFIAANTKIDGEIISEGSIEIRGDVAGVVKGGLLVLVEENVRSDIDAQNIIIKPAKQVRGNLTIDCDCLIEGEVIGNVSSNTIEVVGKVEGNLKAVDSVHLEPSAIIKGDITCSRIKVEYGAIIEGNVRLIAKTY